MRYRDCSETIQVSPKQSLVSPVGVMDHSDDKGGGDHITGFLPQQEQTQQQQQQSVRRQQARSQQQQQLHQWPHRSPGYPQKQPLAPSQHQYPQQQLQQQQQVIGGGGGDPSRRGVAAAQHPPPPPYGGQQQQQQQAIPVDTRMDATTMMHAPPPPPPQMAPGQEVDYRTQQHAAAVGGNVGYHPQGGPYVGYPPQYQQQPQPPPPPHQQPMYQQQQQQIPLQQQPLHMQQPPPPPPPQHMGGAPPPPHIMDQQPPPPPPISRPVPAPQQQQPYGQPPHMGRPPTERPLVKLSVSLIDTYKRINKVYYEERQARREARAAAKAAEKGQGVNNNGWDDENFDYIVTSGEVFYGRYVIKERIGKGSFGQVVRGVDMETNKDVAIKIIKSKKPFLMQAKTEIELLSHLCEKDRDDQNNIVRLLTHFIYRNHQCLVFEMLSLNLYELLKNTQFGGVSLNLIRKFAKQILRALCFLAQPDVDIIHCDLKPENILLRHPKRSGVKVIDFGSSCKSNKRMYSYIQSRFYRSPEVMLGLPYTVAIDMWSLGCILAEMHTGEPLFSGSDQFDQMQKIVKLLGMVPGDLLDKSSDQSRSTFFRKVNGPKPGTHTWILRQENPSSSQKQQKQSSSSSTAASSTKEKEPKEEVIPSTDPIATLSEVICAETSKRKKHPPSEAETTARNYEMFVDLIYRMLSYDAKQRITPEAALRHPFILSGESPSIQTTSSSYAQSSSNRGQSSPSSGQRRSGSSKRS